MNNRSSGGPRPIVSVCMASYNGAAFIHEQVASILEELTSSDELVIVDDASSDATVEIINRFEDKRIKLHCRDVNQGVVSSFEQSIFLASGKVIFLCDQDDLWYPGKVNAMINSMYEKKVVAVVSDCHIIDSNGDVVEPSFFFIRQSKSGFFANLWKNGYLGCAMCFSADLKDVILPFPNGVSMHDEWIGLTADLSGRVLFLDRVLSGYRRHSHNVTNMVWSGLLFATKKRLLNLVLVGLRTPAIIRYRIRSLFAQNSRLPQQN
jgi:glycosyltransferase involved in cell wall biosynthesis